MWALRGWRSSHWVGEPDRSLKPDLQSAADVLQTFYQKGANERQRFEIASFIARVDQDQYESLGRKRRPIDVMVAPGTLDDGYKPAGPYVLARIDYSHLPWECRGNDDPTGGKLVLKSIATGLEYSLGGTGGMDGWNKAQAKGDGGSGAWVSPDRLRPGRYRVFVRLVRDSRTICDSVGFEITEDGKPVLPERR
jgi:hypothetical protein